MSKQVCHVGLSLLRSSGGTGESISHFSQALGGRVISFTPRSSLGLEPSSVEGTLHAAVPDRGWAARLMKPDPQDLIEAERIASESDLLICNVLYRYHANWVYRMARRYNIPYWVVLHGALDPYVFSYNGLQKRIWMSVWGRKILRGAQRVICATQQERCKSDAYYRGANKCVVRWPVSLPDLERKAQARESLRRRHARSDHEKLLLYIGRLEKMKRPLETIEALARSGTENLRLLIAGPDETYDTDRLRRHAQELGVDRVTCLGPVYGEDKEDLFLGVDAYISLSWRENFGYTTAEALAAGTPVILSPGNDLQVELNGCDCGWMLSTNEISEASEALRQLSAATSETCREKGENGRAWCEKHLSFTRFRDDLQALLAEVPDLLQKEPAL